MHTQIKLTWPKKKSEDLAPNKRSSSSLCLVDPFLTFSPSLRFVFTFLPLFLILRSEYFIQETMAEEYVLFADRPEWKDLVPIPQKEAENPLVPIAYTAHCENPPYSSDSVSTDKSGADFRSLSIPTDTDAMNYFRALVHASERSERGLDLTDVLIRLNPGHYSIWCVFLPSSHGFNGEADEWSSQGVPS